MNKLYKIGGATIASLLIYFAWFGLQGSSPTDPYNPTPFVKPTFSAVVFDSVGTVSDTSGILRINGANYISYSAYYTGASSATMTSYVLGEVGGLYIPVHSFTQTTNALDDDILRTASWDSLGAVKNIKIANTVTFSAEDTLTYYSNLMSKIIP